MATSEDAATVLEQFIHDVANLPAEIQHLFEEIQAKDKIIQDCRNTINARDSSIQKFIKMNGSLTPNPKEEAYNRTILQNYDKAQVLQEEKIGLSEKASVLLDRHIKRLDVKIRDLQNEGVLSVDPSLPSLLHSVTSNRGPPLSSSGTGTSTPLNPLSGNAIPSTTIANSGLARLAHPAPSGGSPSVGPNNQPPHPLLSSAQMSNSTPASPGSNPLLHSRHRESSTGSVGDSKRRRLNAHLGTLPQPSSGLARQSSLGPGTPKAGTPSSVRAGSAGPRGVRKLGKKVAPHQQVKRKPPIAKLKKSRKGGQGGPASVGSDEDESALSEVSNSDSENHSVTSGGGRRGSDNPMGDAGDGDEEEGGDDRKYCTCRSVSYGNMVACDNDDCPYEWFHWSCVGLTTEPRGKWFCEECRSRMGRV